MDRARKVQDLWSWLPAFRAVAETEHLPTAAERLHVTPSALSRSVRLLEDELGQPLFHRVGRNLKLSDAGHAFLGAVRDAMRLVDDGMGLVQGRRLAGALHVSSPDAVLPAVADVALALRAQHEELVVHVHQVPASQAHARLLSGALDVALLDVDLTHERVERFALGALGCSIYAGRDHPLHGRETLDLDEALAFDFVALDPARDAAPDPWPANVERSVAIFASRTGIAHALCAEGKLLAVLPDVLVTERDGLSRLPLPLASAIPLAAHTRPELMEGGKAAVFLDALRVRLATGKV
jgi:DNA-binding transcriptional LysR family regulator